MQGRRRPDTPRGVLPDDPQPGDYWKVLDRSSGKHARSDREGNLTHGVWQVIPPVVGFSACTLEWHTVREHEDGTISIRPGDGSSNSILAHKRRLGLEWHGYIEHGEWRSV